MSTSEMVPNPSITPLVLDLLPEVEIVTGKASEPSSASASGESYGGRPDKLSTRELEVLRYLPTMLTANEIAAELYVSVNTIKAHMKSIYRKLGASRRQEAVVRAYQCGIIQPRSFLRPSADVEVK